MNRLTIMALKVLVLVAMLLLAMAILEQIILINTVTTNNKLTTRARNLQQQQQTGSHDVKPSVKPVSNRHTSYYYSRADAATKESGMTRSNRYQRYQTTWTCTGEGRARACLFRNIFREKKSRTFWIANSTGRQPPEIMTTNKWGYPQSFGSLEESTFLKENNSVKYRAGDHLYVDQTWTHNIGHALWDGLFSSWTAMLMILDGKPPAEFRIVLNAYDQTNETFNESLFRQALQKFGGNGLITYLDDRSLKVHDPSIDAGWECFARIVIGAGAKGLRWYQKDMRMAGTKYMRAFRDRMLVMHGIKPSSSEQQNIISVFENKRYGEQGVMREIQQAISNLQHEGLNVEYVKWKHIARRYDLIGNLSSWEAQLAAVTQTSVYVTAPGTGMMLAPFLPDGAVVVNLLSRSSFMVNVIGNGVAPFELQVPDPMEDSLLGSVDYIRALYYPMDVRLKKPGIQHVLLEELIRRAAKLVKQQFKTPIDDLHLNLSPASLVLNRACDKLPAECNSVLEVMNGLRSCPKRLQGADGTTFSFSGRELMLWPAQLLQRVYLTSRLRLDDHQCIPNAYREAILKEADEELHEIRRTFDSTHHASLDQYVLDSGKFCDRPPLQRLVGGKTTPCDNRECVFDDVVVAATFPEGWISSGDGESHKAILKRRYIRRQRRYMRANASSDCIAYGVGIHDNFQFEASLVKQGCTVHAFDCTTRDVDNRMARAGVIFEPICIGESSDLPGQIYQDHLSSVTAASNGDTHNAFVSSSQDPVFMPLNDVLDSHGHSHLDLLKMDIEGHEWRIFEHEIIGSGSQRLDSLPYEISFELHTEMANKAYVSEALVKGKNKRGVNELFIKLWKLGYRVISKVLNSGDPACCEFVVARLGSVNNVSDTWRNIVRSSHDVCPARRVWFGPFTKTRSSG